MKKLAIFTVILCGFLGGWGSSSVPSCDDENIKKEVVAMVTSRMKDQLVPRAVIAAGDAVSRFFLYTYEEYVVLKNTSEDETEREFAAKVVRFIDELTAKVTITLKYIRVNQRFDDIQKIECGGNIFFLKDNDLNTPIIYTLQYTEDDNIYIEIYGLE
ncbi:MAG: hypothetical protein AB1598_12000 [Thermodesulfobacteriota bacterium]